MKYSLPSLTVLSAAFNAALLAVGTSAATPVAVAAAPVVPQQVTVSIRADSEALGFEAWRAMDGKTDTMWHTGFSEEGKISGTNPSLPHTLIVDLRAPRELKGFTLAPRQDSSDNGSIRSYEVYVTDTPDTPGSAVASGEFTSHNKKDKNSIRFATPKIGRYFILKALSAANGRKDFASVAELHLDCDTATFRAEKMAFSGTVGTATS